MSDRLVPPEVDLRPSFSTGPQATTPAAPEGDAEVDSEPRRRWRPNAELLRALADARKDLKPGESSLFWDWTATRDAAPEAEEMRPSGEGEVFVCDKEAAAAYIAPVSVAPAAPPRPNTKSRIRVREDVDPRRQPTVRTRADGRMSRFPPAFRDASDSAPPSDRGPRLASCVGPAWAENGGSLGRPAGARTSDRPRFTPSEPPAAYTTRAVDRRRRLGAALLLGCVAGTIVFFWLRFPREKVSPQAPPGSAAIVEAAPSVSATASPAETVVASAKAPESSSAPEPIVRSDWSPPRSHAVPVATAPARAPDEPAPPSRAAPDPDPPKPREAPSAPRKTGFLIRKKGSN